MRLLDTETYTLAEFQSNIPPYAILSHMWQREEVTFRDIADLDKAKKMQGFAKIVGACKTAVEDDFKYIWIDTCCINKESSAELSEAINSMYAWYKNARVCYAYLWDVPSEGSYKSPPSLFATSLWFGRGWTLQELIAPENVIFYGADWVDIGTKASLHKVISTITGISTKVIVGEMALDKVAAAVRMSWAADRNTTREEDVAYSLMGIFGINMPLLYGEGRKAFIRLQHEIIRQSNDQSIFAWTTDRDQEERGILAHSPREFRKSGEVQKLSPPAHYYDDPEGDNQIMSSPIPYSITNQGLCIELPAVLEKNKYSAAFNKVVAFLNCYVYEENIAIVLRWSNDLQKYMRCETSTLLSQSRTPRDSAQLTSLYIAEDGAEAFIFYRSPRSPSTVHLEVKVPSDCRVPNIIHGGVFRKSILDQRLIFSAENPNKNLLFLVFNEPDKFKPFAVVVGARKQKKVWCGLLEDIKPEGQSDEEILTAYRTSRNVRQLTEMPFIDRAYANLTNGWAVAVSLDLPSDSQHSYVYGRVEIMASPVQQGPMSPLVRPSVTSTTYLIIPPSTQHGFVVDTNHFQQAPPTINWVQHPHSFILSMSGSTGPVELPFESTTTKEMLYLVLDISKDVFPHKPEVCSSIEKETHVEDFYEKKWVGTTARTYSATLGSGKSVFVVQRECKDRSVADFIITLSM